MKDRITLAHIASMLILLLVAILTYNFVSNQSVTPSDEQEHRPTRVMERSDGKPNSPDDGSSHSVAVPFFGPIGYSQKKSGVPEGDWLERPDGKAFRKEKVEKWAMPEVFYGDQGEILHAYFTANMKPTFSLESVALQKIRDDSGLAILRAGYPDGVDVEDASRRLLKATRESWMMGLESGFIPDSSFEISFTPVIVEVLSSGGPLSGVKDDHRWVGQRVPMVLVMKSIGPPGRRAAIMTNSALDSVPVKDRIRRSWVLYPYMPGGPDGPDQVVTVDDVCGGALLDEPLLEAWESLKAGER